MSDKKGYYRYYLSDGYVVGMQDLTMALKSMIYNATMQKQPTATLLHFPDSNNELNPRTVITLSINPAYADDIDSTVFNK